MKSLFQMINTIVHYGVTLCLFCNLNGNENDSLLFDKDGQARKALVQILAMTNIKCENSIKSIVKTTQQGWLRKEGLERWNVFPGIYKDHEKFWHLFDKVALTQELRPSLKMYDYALFMGESVQGMKKRLDYLIVLWKQGVRFANLVLLSGARLLDESAQDKKFLHDQFGKHCQNVITEFEAAQLLIDALLPYEVRQNIVITNVDAPTKKNFEGRLVRPTTDDTIDAWMVYEPKPGSCLVISNQPYGRRQALVVRNKISKNFLVDVAASRLNENERNDVVMLDELARLIYQESLTLFTQKSSL